MNTQLKAFPLSFHPSISNVQELEYSNKIILPPSILEFLLDEKKETDVIFEVKKKNDHVQTLYLTAQEFSSTEGICYMSIQNMNQCWLCEGDEISITIQPNIPKGTSITLRTTDNSYLDMDDYKKELERSIVKRYSVCSTSDSICINHNNKEYIFDVIQTEPADVIDMRNTDVDLHIVVHKDTTVSTNHVDTTIVPKKTSRKKRKSRVNQSKNGYKAFCGKGYRLGD